MDEKKVDRPVRVAIFSTLGKAEQAVTSLLEGGFSREQISVICSEKYKEQFFGDMAKPVHSARQVPTAIVTGGAVGATLGGLALAATAIATGGASLLAAGTVLIGGGALAGTFTGAMATRGFEKEIADYYDSAVQVGKILVAVEDKSEQQKSRLADAERIFSQAGADPVKLVEG